MNPQEKLDQLKSAIIPERITFGLPASLSGRHITDVHYTQDDRGFPAVLYIAGNHIVFDSYQIECDEDGCIDQRRRVVRREDLLSGIIYDRYSFDTIAVLKKHGIIDDYALSVYEDYRKNHLKEEQERHKKEERRKAYLRLKEEFEDESK